MKSAITIIFCFICSAYSAQTGDAMDNAYRKQRFYDQDIRRGDSCMKMKDVTWGKYLSAVMYYKDALQQKPDEQYPKDRICEADMYIPDVMSCPYDADRDGFFMRRKAYNKKVGDSLLAMGDPGRAGVYYQCILNAEHELDAYFTKQVRICDSLVHNAALKNFDSRFADSLLGLKQYFDARINYQELYRELLSISAYIANRQKFVQDSLYLLQQFAACDPYIPFDTYRFALQEEECDGPSSYCYAIAEAAAEKAVSMKDYITAKEFYDGREMIGMRRRWLR